MSDDEPITLGWLKSIGAVYSKWHLGYVIVVTSKMTLHCQDGEALVRGMTKPFHTRGQVAAFLELMRSAT